MNFEMELNKIYREIANHINEMIPLEWKEFYFNGELKDGSGEVYFFYTLPSDPNKYFYSYCIPEDCGVDREIYEELEDELFELLCKLQNTFKKEQMELWYSFFMLLDSEGRMKAEYNYLDWSESDFGPTDVKKYFQYKKLHRTFADEEDNKLMLEMSNYEEKLN